MRRGCWLVVMLGVGIAAGLAWAERMEFVAYYPAPGTGPDWHVRSLTVGTKYANETPKDGQMFVWDRVGIGQEFTANDSPTQPLEVLGNVLVNSDKGALFIANRRVKTIDSGLQLLTNKVSQWTIGSRGDGTEDFQIFSNVGNGGTRLLIKQGSGGEVGIGTTNPQGRLHLVGADDAVSKVLFMPGTDIRVGIGTTAPAGLLHVVGANDAVSKVVFTPGADTARAGTPDIRMGIGTANPVVRLEVQGQVKIEDGTVNKLGKVLTSDANGLGSWQAPPGGLQFTTPTIVYKGSKVMTWMTINLSGKIPAWATVVLLRVVIVHAQWGSVLGRKAPGAMEIPLLAVGDAGTIKDDTSATGLCPITQDRKFEIFLSGAIGSSGVVITLIGYY